MHAHAQTHTFKQDNQSAFIISPNPHFHLLLLKKCPQITYAVMIALTFASSTLCQGFLSSAYAVPASWSVFPPFTYKTPFSSRPKSNVTSSVKFSLIYLLEIINSLYFHNTYPINTILHFSIVSFIMWVCLHPLLYR